MAHDFKSPSYIVSAVASLLLAAAPLTAQANVLYGIADSSGNIVTKPQFTGLQYLSPNVYVAFDDSGAQDEIDSQGKKLGTAPQKQLPNVACCGAATRWLSDDLAIFADKGKCGVCDKTGKVILEAKYQNIGYAGEEIVVVTEADDFNFPCKFYNREGKLLFKTNHRIYHGQQFSEGLLLLGSWNDRIVYIDTNGKEKIVGALTSGEPFHSGLAAVTFETRESKGSGYINHDGDIVIGPFKDATVQQFDRGYGVVCFYVYDFAGQSSPMYGVTDGKGKLVIPAIYESISRFNRDFFVVKKEGKLLLLDTSGKVVSTFPKNCIEVMPTDSDDMEQLIPCAEIPSTAGLAPYEKSEQIRGKWGFCNWHGQWKVPPQFDVVEPFKNGLAPVYKNTIMQNRVGLIRLDGSFRLPLTSGSIQRCPDGSYIVGNDDGTDQQNDKINNTLDNKRIEYVFPRALREHDLIGMPKETLTRILGDGEKTSYPRAGIPPEVKETVQYLFFAGQIHCGNASHWLEVGFDASGKVYGWRNIGFQWEGKWCRENVVFPEHCLTFRLTEAIPKTAANRLVN